MHQYTSFARVAWLGAIAAPLIVPAVAVAQPATVDLLGTVRDFRQTHPDFNASASGHYAGLVSDTMGITNRPVYTGPGYRVATQWTDASARNIPPHLSGVASGGCVGMPIGAHATANIWIGNQSEVYGYIYGSVAPGGVQAVLTTNQNSSGECEVIGNSEVWGDVLVGPGGNPNDVIRTTPNGYIYGSTGTLPAPISVPEVVLPTGLGPSIGNVTYSSGVIHITGDMHVTDFTITSSARVVVPTGSHVTILVDGHLLINANSNASDGLFVEPGASLNLYVTADGDVDILSSRVAATNGDPSLINFYKQGEASGSVNSRDIDLRGNGSLMNCVVVAPGADLEMTQSSEFWGTFIGREVDLENRCKLYLDMSLLTGAPGDVPGVAGAAGGSIQSAATFDQWFQDTLGENLARPHAIRLVRDGSGVYEYLDDDFHPIDGDLYGNEGDANNNNFTYQVDATFTYESCGGQFVEFAGADDMWLFIDGALVMDLGGVQPLTPQYLQLDRLGLTDGQTYDFSLFYAQRNATISRFRLRTNIVLDGFAPPMNISASFD